MKASASNDRFNPERGLEPLFLFLFVVTREVESVRFPRSSLVGRLRGHIASDNPDGGYDFVVRCLVHRGVSLRERNGDYLGLTGLDAFFSSLSKSVFLKRR